MPDDTPTTTMDDRARLARFVSADESRSLFMQTFCKAPRSCSCGAGIGST